MSKEKRKGRTKQKRRQQKKYEKLAITGLCDMTSVEKVLRKCSLTPNREKQEPRE